MSGRTRRMTALAATVAIAILPASALAGPVRPGETEGLGLFGRDAPEILQKAKTDPYAPPAEPVCETLPQEIEALNAALGPDADQAQKKPNQAAKWVGGAIRGLIPHRDVIRFLTGAGKKDEALKQAAMAGWARRGYLKGLAKTLDCTSPKQVIAGAPAPPKAPPVETEAPTAGAPQPVLTPASAVDSAADAAAIAAQPVNP